MYFVSSIRNIQNYSSNVVATLRYFVSSYRNIQNYSTNFVETLRYFVSSNRNIQNYSTNFVETSRYFVSSNRNFQNYSTNFVATLRYFAKMSYRNNLYQFQRGIQPILQQLSILCMYYLNKQIHTHRAYCDLYISLLARHAYRVVGNTIKATHGKTDYTLVDLQLSCDIKVN